MVPVPSFVLRNLPILQILQINSLRGTFEGTFVIPNEGYQTSFLRESHIAAEFRENLLWTIHAYG